MLSLYHHFHKHRRSTARSQTEKTKFCFPFWIIKKMFTVGFLYLLTWRSMESTNLPMHTKHDINFTCKLNQWRLFLLPTYCLMLKSMHIRTDKHTHIDRQRHEHMSWRTRLQLAQQQYTYGLGQRECDLQTLPLSRRRKMGQNNRNRLRRFLHQLSPQHYMLPTVPKRLVVTPEGWST